MILKYAIIAILCLGVVHGYTLPGHTVQGTIDMYGNKVLNSTTPVNDTDLVTKGYADNLTGSSSLPLTGGTLTGWLNLSSLPLLSVGTPVNDTDGSTKKYVDDSISDIPSFNGGIITNWLDLSSLPLQSVGAPVNDTDASTKKYVDDKAALYLPLAGGTLSGQVNFGAKPLYNIGAPTNDTDASTKKYVDDNTFSPTRSFYFTGTTGEDFEDFILANGEGNYYIENLINVTEELTISTPYVSIHGTSYMWNRRVTDGPWFSVDMSSGKAINITADYVTLDHITAITSVAASTADVITFSGNFVEIISPSIYVPRGTGIKLIGDPFYYVITDPNIGMEQDAATGIGVYSYGGGASTSFHGTIKGGLISGGATGIKFREGSGFVENVYILESSASGITVAPAKAYGSRDIVIRGCTMDYIDGPGLSIPGTWATASIALDNCWLYTNSADACIWAKNVTNLLVTNCPMIYSTNDHGLYFDSVCSSVTISNNYLYAPYTGKSGVLVADVASNTDFLITSNRVYGQAYGIAMGSTKCDHWTITSNSGTISSGSASATKILANNRV